MSVHLVVRGSNTAGGIEEKIHSDAMARSLCSTRKPYYYTEYYQDDQDEPEVVIFPSMIVPFLPHQKMSVLMSVRTFSTERTLPSGKSITLKPKHLIIVIEKEMTPRGALAAWIKCIDHKNGDSLTYL